MGERTTVTVQQAMGICGVSRRTVYNWMAKGKMTISRTPGGSPRLYKDELIREVAPVDSGVDVDARPILTPAPVAG